MDSRRQIPLTGFLNGCILPKIDDLPEVRAVYAETMRTLGKPSFEYSMMNVAHAVSMLYCLVVVPWELLLSDVDLLDSVKAESLSKRFEIIVSDASFREDPEFQLLRHLRNAVSHARFEISDNRQFEFSDRDKKNELVWRAKIEWDDLLSVLTKLGHHFGQVEL